MLGLWILAILIIILAACILPWWFIPSIFLVMILSEWLFGKKY